MKQSLWKGAMACCLLVTSLGMLRNVSSYLSNYTKTQQEHTKSLRTVEKGSITPCDNPADALPTKCNLLKGLKVLVTGVHMEGNLGDEMETTPFLRHLHECGVETTAVFGIWLKREKDRLHDRTSREQAYVSHFTNQRPLDPYKDYVAVILAPGPWDCQHPYPVDIYFGGTFKPEKGQCKFTNPDSKLVVTREPLSYDFATKQPAGNSTEVFMSGDLSFSYQATKSSLEYYIDYYTRRGYSNRTLVFSRHNNFGHGVKISEGNVTLKLAEGKTKLFKLSEVVLASSSDIEDGSFFQRLEREFSVRDYFIGKTVEQLFALISISSHVYTDRYHPGVASYIHGVPFSVLDYPKENIKLAGLSRLAHKMNFTFEEIKKLNDEAFDKMDNTLAKIAAEKGLLNLTQ